MRTNDNQPGGRDLVGHSGVQPWSAGPIFPGIIARVEVYSPDGAMTHFGTHWTLTYPGQPTEVFTTYDAAEATARWYNAEVAVRAAQPHPVAHVHELAHRIYEETHH